MASREKAPQACRPCRRLKRKCTRELPSCSLCLRLGKSCGYPLKSQQDASENTDFLLQRIQQLEHERDHAWKQHDPSGFSIPPNDAAFPINDWLFPSPPPASRTQLLAELFLSSETFTTPPLNVLDPGREIPKPILEILDSPETIDCICDRYLNSVHKWLPMISRKRLAQQVTTIHQKPDAALALLLSCMKLVCYPLVYDLAQTPLYYTVKQFYFTVEDSCLMSIHLLQAAILIAVYEIGHGVYPAGYLSICHAARLGITMGLHDRKYATQVFKPSDTWTLREEERRTWWAVVVLDRYVHSGTTGYHLATSEPPQNDLLPCDDSSWELGEIGTNEPLFASSPSSCGQGSSFASMCRGSHILGRVLRHRDDRGVDLPFQLSEAAQLHRALIALESSFDNSLSFNESVVPRALCYNARFTLYNLYACNETCNARYGDARLGEETDMQQSSQQGLKYVTNSVYELTQHLQHAISIDIESISPLVVHCIFQALGECAWFVREGGDDSMRTSLDTMMDVLDKLRKRWKVCERYIKILEAQEGIVPTGRAQEISKP